MQSTFPLPGEAITLLLSGDDIGKEKLKSSRFCVFLKAPVSRETQELLIWIRIWHLVKRLSPTVYLPSKTNLIGVLATDMPTGDVLSLFPFYVKRIAKGLPSPKCSLLLLQIICYHALRTGVLHAHDSGLSQNWARGGKIWKKFGG